MYRRGAKSLFRHFLKDSPSSLLKRYQEVFPRFQPDRQQINKIPSDPAYLQRFLRSVQGFGMPVSQIKLHRPLSLGDLSKIFSQTKVNNRSRRIPAQQPEQLFSCIRELTNLGKAQISDYQQLEQRLVIAQPETISAVKTKLIYLFKLLLNRRDKISNQSLEMHVNIHLSQTIIKVFERNSQFQGKSRQWNQLQAIEKLSRAREYKKNGMSKVASDSFTEIFMNQEANYQTRLQALRILCQEGEQKGDTGVLEPLVEVAQETGEKQYQEYLQLIIRKIKKGQQKTSNSE